MLTVVGWPALSDEHRKAVVHLLASWPDNIAIKAYKRAQWAKNEKVAAALRPYVVSPDFAQYLSATDTPDKLAERVREGDTRVVKALLQLTDVALPASLITEAIKSPWPVPMVNLLLSYGTAVDAQTLFKVASWNGPVDQDIIERLIAEGASADEAMNLAQTAKNQQAIEVLARYVTKPKAAARPAATAATAATAVLLQRPVLPKSSSGRQTSYEIPYVDFASLNRVTYS
jgi:hypothetical protein